MTYDRRNPNVTGVIGNCSLGSHRGEIAGSNFVVTELPFTSRNVLYTEKFTE